jgi:acetyltransferase-like isoleucine patch superfamily enzyme
MPPAIHPLADVQSAHIGPGTRIWQFCVVLPDAKIGTDCNICAHVFIENDVVIGDRVTIKCGVQLWDGLRVASGVFIGPNVTFSNDPYPRSQQRIVKFAVTTVHQGASIGANVTILPGITIGPGAMIGAGSVVTKDIPAKELWLGNPARFRRKL